MRISAALRAAEIRMLRNVNLTGAKIWFRVRSARNHIFAVWAALRAAQTAKLSQRRIDVEKGARSEAF
jgi:hypothetical protein